MLSNEATRADTPAFTSVVPGLSVLRDVFVNLYYAFPQDQPQGPWVLIDAGLPGSADKIKQHAEELFGKIPPAAILLTHGHFDHAGALHGLLEAWPDVQVYAHPLEMPYLTGLSSYPPPDPTVGRGMMAYMSFVYPKKPYDFGSRVQTLPADGSVPGLPGWRWVHTPGHSFGHVSFFRQHDKVLVAGDAFTTVKQESGSAVYYQKQEVHGPPAYFTPDWDSARASMELLTRMEPEVAATGHGIPMHGAELRRQLNDFVPRFDTLARPKKGRYVHQPATADGGGVTSVPPPVVNPWVKGLAVAGLAVGLLALVTGGKKKNRSGRARKSASAHSTGGTAGSGEGQPEGNYRAWYRDSPAEYQADRHASYEPHSSQQRQHNQDFGQARGDHRYSEQQGRRIETQYP